MLVGVTVTEWESHLNATDRGSAYQASPGCGVPFTRASRADGCAWTPATVVTADRQEDDSGEDTTYTYFLTLRLADGTMDREEIPAASDWSTVSRGETVKAEVWRDRVTQIASGADRFPTWSNPLYERNHPGMLLLVALPLFTLGYSSVLVMAVVARWRRR